MAVSKLKPSSEHLQVLKHSLTIGQRIKEFQKIVSRCKEIGEKSGRARHPTLEKSTDHFYKG